MTKRLQSAVQQAERLSERDQEVLAAIIEEEIADELRWQQRFAETPHVLERIAERAKSAFNEGLCSDL